MSASESRISCGACRRRRLHRDQFVADDAHHARARTRGCRDSRRSRRRACSAPRRFRRGPAPSGARAAIRGWRAPARRTAGSCHPRRGYGGDRRSGRSTAAHVARGPDAPINARAAPDIGDRCWIRRITSSMFATAIAKARTWICAWITRLLSRNLVRRVTTSSRNSRNAVEHVVQRHHLRGRPLLSAIMLVAVPSSCIAVKRQSWSRRRRRPPRASSR